MPQQRHLGAPYAEIYTKGVGRVSDDTLRAAVAWLRETACCGACCRRCAAEGEKAAVEAIRRGLLVAVDPRVDQMREIIRRYVDLAEVLPEYEALVMEIAHG